MALLYTHIQPFSTVKCPKKLPLTMIENQSIIFHGVARYRYPVKVSFSFSNDPIPNSYKYKISFG